MAYSALSQNQGARFPDELADVRGYEVRTRADDDKVGRVNDLVYTSDGGIRYLDLELGGFFNRRHVLLPIGAAQVDAQNNVVWVSGLTKDEIKNLPDYEGDARVIDDDYESRILGARASRDVRDEDLYDQGRFYAERGGEGARDARLILSEEELVVGKRQVQAGEVGARKVVETEHVRKTVPVMHEEVTVERHPVSGDATANVDIGEQEIRIPLMAEEVVAEKRAVAKEEVLLRKHAVTEERVVEDDVRRERLDVDDSVVEDRGADRAARGARRTEKGVADAVDDLKDRVDGNPASRPGPDPTDRPGRF
jgi:uncharacterized protein (TIGR02271 family)